MLVGIITRYLADHRRLVIPQLGALLVKEPDHIVLFSELLKKDDGILSQLLVETGMSELEAAGAINRLVFEVKHSLTESGKYIIEGLGTFSMSSNGAIKFDSEPLKREEVTPSPIEQEPEEVIEDRVIEKEEVTPEIEEQPSQEEPQEDEPKKKNLKIKQDPFGEKKNSQQHYDLYSQDPDLKGLHYSRPRIVGNGGMSSRPTQRVDKWMVIAIAAAVIAVAALLYGYSIS